MKNLIIVVSLALAFAAVAKTPHEPSNEKRSDSSPAAISPGPPRLDFETSQVMHCKTDYDCNDAGSSNNVCTEGVCLCDAAHGYSRCGKGSSNQQCSNVLNGLYCGQCGRECPKGQLCNNGKCGKVSCPAGEVMCIAHCSNLKTSQIDCGRCGHQCPDGLTCVNSRCKP